MQLLAAFSARASATEQLRFMFDVYDVDGDGAVSRTDLLTLMRSRAGSQLSDEQLGALVYGAMSELRVPANRADRAAPTREKNVIAR